MRVFVAVVAALALVAVHVEAKNWALLVAGSSGYYNYRHQADVCDAYQIMHMNGIPDENVVTMFYDDVAGSSENPCPGQLFNWPGGPDVYGGMLKDYTGGDVTPENFLKILQGEDMTGIGSGKTIKSTSDDRIFVAFFDHGAPGLIAFPEGVLHAEDLNTAFKNMHSKQAYKEMALYIEACESGSMFNNILSDSMGIYAITAADPSESSWACDYSSKVNAYLNDCFSINWMLDTRAHDTGSYSLEQQYETVKANTTKSHVCQYGDLSFDSEDIAVFMGKKSSQFASRTPSSDPIETENVRLATIERQLADVDDEEMRAKLFVRYNAEQALKKRAETIFGELNRVFASKESSSNDVCHPADSVDLSCMKQSVNAYIEECFQPDDYSLYHFRDIEGFCRAGISQDKLRATLRDVCSIFHQAEQRACAVLPTGHQQNG